MAAQRRNQNIMKTIRTRILILLGLSLMSQTRAQNAPLVPPDLVPAAGTFISLQNYTNWPPLPFDPLPGLAVYSLGDGVYAYDDRLVDYAAMEQDAQIKRCQGSFSGEG
jgi:hypothetical protein